MKPFRWSEAKNESLKLERGISFEGIVSAVGSGGLLDILEHPNQVRYPGQRILVVNCSGYVFLAPFIEEQDYFFLKTVIPSRKATRVYLNQDEANDNDET